VELVLEMFGPDGLLDYLTWLTRWQHMMWPVYIYIRVSQGWTDLFLYLSVCVCVRIWFVI